MLRLPQPHYAKLIACLDNPRLPDADKERVEEAIRKYQEWLVELDSIDRAQPDTVERILLDCWESLLLRNYLLSKPKLHH